MEFAAEMTVEREGRSNTSENNTVDAAGNPAISFYDSATIQVALLFSQFSSLFFFLTLWRFFVFLVFESDL